MAVHRVGVLFLAADLVGFRDQFPRHPHMHIVERVPEAVVDHGVHHLAVAHAQAFADLEEEVRAIAHGLHAAGDGNVDVAGCDALRGEHHGFEPRTADLVDRERAHGNWEPAAQSSLTCRRLAHTGAHHVAHEAFVHARGIDTGTGDGFAHGKGAQVRRAEIFEHAQELARGCTNGADDD